MWSWVVLLSLLSAGSVVSQSIIKTLPGFTGDLPFKLETGYIGVGELDEVQLFYYFIESERSPKDDPLMLWLTGGPGCSGLSGLLYEIGPFTFNYANSSGNKPTLLLNPYSWTKVANIIFLDAPVGTGFSYAESSDGYFTSDTLSVAQNYEFLRKWLMAHSMFLSNPLYISGDSYSGMTVPIILQEVLNGNEVGDQPPMNLKGYVLGNPFTDIIYDLNSRVKFAHRTALISDQLYESTKRNCKGEYSRPDPSNAPCMEDLQVVSECIAKIQRPHILEPKCSELSPKPNKLWGWSYDLSDSMIDILTSTPQVPRPWCRNYNYLYSYIWANDKTVQNALHTREGTITTWDRCNKSMVYAHNIITSIDYHHNLTKKDLRGLVYRAIWVPHMDLADLMVILKSERMKEEPKENVYHISFLNYACNSNSHTGRRLQSLPTRSKWAPHPKLSESSFLSNSLSMKLLNCMQFRKQGSLIQKHDIKPFGDHDMVIPHVGTQEWIETLNLTIGDSWRPWFVEGQVAGFVTIYTEKKYSLTFTTIKGGGHTAPEYRPRESLAMLERWFAYYLL